MTDSYSGFILQPTYRVIARRPVIHLFGRLADGRTFLVRDDREKPRFWIRASDERAARHHGIQTLFPSERMTMEGEPLLRIEVAVPQEAPPLRDRLHHLGIATFEADVRFAMRYLIDRGIRGAVEIAGEAEDGGKAGPGIDVLFDNPARVGPGNSSPQLSVLSFDIETDPTARRALSIGLYGCGAAEVLLLAAKDQSCPERAQLVASERELIERFATRVRELDPDIITGWAIADFDFPVLLERSQKLGLSLELGRVPGTTTRRAERSRRQATQIGIPGRLVMDGVHLVRGAFVRMERMSLDHVAHQVLGEGKTITAEDRGQEILRLYRDHPQRFVDYNLTDARLALEIVEKLELVELSVARSRLTGMPPDRVSASIAAFDFLYLSELSRRQLVAPSVHAPPEVPPMGGGHLLQPTPGLYEQVLVLDFKSLYPSLIRTFQIDPLGYLGRLWELPHGHKLLDGGTPAPHPHTDLIAAPNSAAFRRAPGILPALLDELMPRREAAKAAGNTIQSTAIKILMNSFFGVLGASSCRFFNPAIADAITSFGREILLWCRDALEARGSRVLYGDTDSLFVAAHEKDPERALVEGQGIVDHLNQELAQHIQETWGVESRLELELEHLFLRLLLPPVRHAAQNAVEPGEVRDATAKKGAMKKYAGLVYHPSKPRVVFVGLEAVRRDWTPLARATQREIIERLFEERPIEGFLRERALDLRQGRLDDELVYRKALRKAPDAYQATTPPHVAAARKSNAPQRRVIEYVMTTAGAEPAAEQEHPLDYEHYVQRQLRPVVEPVLELLGLDFDRVIGDDRQLELF